MATITDSEINQILTEHWSKIENSMEIVVSETGSKKKVITHEEMNILMGELFRKVGSKLNQDS